MTMQSHVLRNSLDKSMEIWEVCKLSEMQQAHFKVEKVISLLVHLTCLNNIMLQRIVWWAGFLQVTMRYKIQLWQKRWFNSSNCNKEVYQRHRLTSLKARSITTNSSDLSNFNNNSYSTSNSKYLTKAAIAMQWWDKLLLASARIRLTKQKVSKTSLVVVWEI